MNSSLPATRASAVKSTRTGIYLGTFEVPRYVPSFRATPHTSYPLKLSCTVTHVYLAKQARAMADLAQLDVGDCNPPAVQGSVI